MKHDNVHGVIFMGDRPGLLINCGVVYMGDRPGLLINCGVVYMGDRPGRPYSESSIVLKLSFSFGVSPHMGF